MALQALHRWYGWAMNNASYDSAEQGSRSRADDGSGGTPKKGNQEGPSVRCTMSTLLLCCSCVCLNYMIYSKVLGMRLRRLAPSPGAMFAADTMANLPYGNVVMLESTYSTYTQHLPWQTVSATFQDGVAGAMKARGSGLLLGDGFILTAGYIATDSRFITANRQGNGTKHEAKVIAFAPEFDLALLQVADSDAGRFQLTSDMKIEVKPSKLLGLGHEVVVAGFQVDMDESLVRVRSRISRILPKSADNVQALLGRYRPLQVPAMSLYPDVGGTVTVGPVFSVDDGHLAGFLSRAGQVIPAKIVAIFLGETMRNGGMPWKGLGCLGLVMKPMRNPGLRLFWGLPQEDIGVQVRSVAPGSPFESKLQKNDVITHIDEQEIQASGVVSYKSSDDRTNILPFEALLGEKPPGVTSKFKIFRPSLKKAEDAIADLGYKKGSVFDIEVALTPLSPLVPTRFQAVSEDGNQKTSENVPGLGMQPQPPYFIVGGLVWSTLTQELFAQGESVIIPPTTQLEALYRWRQYPSEQVVVLLRTLEHECNKFYPVKNVVGVLSLFNDKPVSNLTQLMESVGAALQSGERYLTFAMKPLGLNNDTAGGKGDPDFVLDTKVCAGADKELLSSMAIANPASSNLMPLYKTVMPSEFIAEKTATQRPVKSSAAAEATVTKATPKSRDMIESVAPKNKNMTESAEDIALPWTNVVQLQMFEVRQSQIQPWQKMVVGRGRCSGIIMDVKTRMILTNSHCVAGVMQLELYREDMRHGVNAQVVEIARDVDLAWVTTDEDSFWTNMNLVSKIDMSDALPYLSSSVRVVGYPMGGSGITITQGIISRLDGQYYPNGLSPGARTTPTSKALIIQIDAAINHGNSGGPVFDTQGKLVGLAFSGLMGVDNTGYVIPNVYLKNFIQSVNPPDKRWIAQPEVGALFRNIENPGLRNYLGMAADETGIQVRTIAPFSPLFNKVQKGDILLSVDGHQVSGDAKVVYEFHEKSVLLPFDTLISEKRPDEKSKMTFLRPGNRSVKRKIFTVTEVFGPLPPLAPRFDDSPVQIGGREAFATAGSYFIMWGLVFGVFSVPLLQEAESREDQTVPWSVTEFAMQQWRTSADQQVIVLMGGLQHACNLFYDLNTMRVLKSLNGKPVKHMGELVMMGIEAQFGTSRFVRLTFEPLADADDAGTVSDPDMVLERQLCSRGMEELLQSNGIPSPVSADLQQVFEISIASAQQGLLQRVDAGNADGSEGSQLQQEDIVEIHGRPEDHLPGDAAFATTSGSFDSALRMQQRQLEQKLIPGAVHERPGAASRAATPGLAGGGTPEQRGGKQRVPAGLEATPSSDHGSGSNGVFRGHSSGQHKASPTSDKVSMSLGSPRGPPFAPVDMPLQIAGRGQAARNSRREASAEAQGAAMQTAEMLESGAMRQLRRPD